MSESMSWLDKIAGSKLLSGATRKRNVPEGLWTKCDSCQSVLYRAELERSFDVCPKCAFHLRQSARKGALAGGGRPVDRNDHASTIMRGRRQGRRSTRRSPGSWRVQ